MGKQPPNDTPQLRTVRAAGARTDPYRTDIDIRDFSYVIAEPEKIGGKNEAPTPMEYVAGALNGCFTVTIEMVAGEQEFRLDGLDVSCEGVVDHRGLFGTAAVSPHFQSVKVDITLATDEAADRLPALENEVLARCPVYNLINDAGTPIDVNWTIRGKNG